MDHQQQSRLKPPPTLPPLRSWRLRSPMCTLGLLEEAPKPLLLRQ